MNEEIGGPSDEDIELKAETGETEEKEPVLEDYLRAIEEWKEFLDGETFFSLQEEFEVDIDTGLGYLFTVAAEHGLDAGELLIKHGLVQNGT